MAVEYQRFTRKRMAGFVAMLALTSLAACGGGGGDSEADVPSTPAAGFARFSGTVVDSTGAPLAQADVYLPYGNGSAWGGKTTDAGTYSFDARASDFSGLSTVALLVSKSGYAPSTVYYSAIQSGANYTQTGTAQSGPRKLAANEAVPVGGNSMFHIGDDSFSGSQNSQLQVSTRGRLIDFELVTWTAQMKAAYTTATVQFAGRGIQTSSCPNNSIGLATLTPAVPSYASPADSDPAGRFTNYKLTVSVTGFAVGSPVRLVAIAGTCAGTDLDDFEFTEMLVTFNS